MSSSWPQGFRKGRCYVIGEVALTHDGSLGLAHAFIDAVAGAGADAVKFQTHIATAESTPGEPFRVKFSRQDATRYDYWQRMEFSDEQWHGLAAHAREQGPGFHQLAVFAGGGRLCSIASALPCGRWRPVKWRTSRCSTPWPRARRPVLLSTGMSPFDELDATVARLRAAACRRRRDAVHHGVSVPAGEGRPERAGGVPRTGTTAPSGLSDHSGTMFPSLAAAALGADVVEVHVTLSREMFGPDVHRLDHDPRAAR